MKFYNLSLGFVFYITIILFFSCQKSKEVDTLNFSMSFPPNFKIDTNYNNSGILVLKEFKNNTDRIYTPNINVITKRIENLNIDKYFEKEEKLIQTTATIIEKERIKFDDKECLKLILESSQRNISITYIQYTYVKRDVVSTLTFSCREEEISDYFKSIDNSFLSFKFK